VGKAYLLYLKANVGDQDKPWVPHIFCKASVESLREWTKGTLKNIKFGVPIVWREPKIHFNA